MGNSAHIKSKINPKEKIFFIISHDKDCPGVTSVFMIVGIEFHPLRIIGFNKVYNN